MCHPCFPIWLHDKAVLCGFLMLQSETNTDRVEGGGELPFLKVFIAQIASYLSTWNGGKGGLELTETASHCSEAKVASSVLSRCSPNSSDSDPDMFIIWIHFTACVIRKIKLQKVMMSVYSFSEKSYRICYETAEMNVFITFGRNSRCHPSEQQNHIKPGIYSPRRKQLRLIR